MQPLGRPPPPNQKVVVLFPALDSALEFYDSRLALINQIQSSSHFSFLFKYDVLYLYFGWPSE